MLVTAVIPGVREARKEELYHEPSAPDICSKAPECCSYEETDVLSQFKEGTIELELVNDRW